MAELISKRYATSLLEAGLELDKTEKFYDELKSISQVLESEEKLQEILRHPKITKDEKKSLISSVFEGRLSQEILNFLYIIIDKRRERHLLEIIEEYRILFNEYKGIIDVVAITAVPMEKKSREKLKLVLENKLNKKIQLSNEIDNSIIGGVLLKMGDRIIDSTLTSQLKDMEAIIKNISI